MGTVVFPAAEVKFFLNASLNIRGERRFKQYRDKGKAFDLDKTIREIEKRDSDDTRRALSPLKSADDAIEVDSTKMNIEEVVEAMLKIVQQRLPSSSK
jgi:cytidylate kinase